MPTSIQQFVENKQQVHTKCWTCNLPEAEDLNAAFNGGIQVALLCAWLVEERGYTDNGTTDPSGRVFEGRLRGHFRRGHHLERVIS